MVIEALFEAASWLLRTLISAFPAWSAPELDLTPFTEIVGKVGWLNGWVNVPLIVTLLGLLLPAIAICVTIRVSLWVYERIPFKAT